MVQNTAEDKLGGHFREVWAHANLQAYINTFTAKIDNSRFNNSCLRLQASTLVDQIFQFNNSCLRLPPSTLVDQIFQ
jgi:hypothetical protein